jgi:CDP-2,3-bis-(O-geranylgeranyl)-sn-glycerol synthase
MLDLLWFLPWCVVVNISFDILIWLGRMIPWIGRRNTPIDNHVTLSNGHRLLGDSTTWLGLMQACILGLLGQIIVPGHYFFLLALLVWCGHAVGSFIKRRLGLSRGTYVPGLDHIDYVMLAGGVLCALGSLSLGSWIIAILIMIIITPGLTFIAHAFGIRSQPI